MLFNSLDYILIFLPITGVAYLFINKSQNLNWAKGFLIVASLAFYAWWKVEYLALLLVSIILNYGFGQFLIQKQKKPMLVIGIVFNLTFLVYFKYLYFFSGLAESYLGMEFNIPKVVLPLAISFFTFQQIAYLVDAFRNKVGENSFSSYVLFVCFFPQLISGPIVHHSSLIPQFNKFKLIDFNFIACGVTLFIIGLSKKVLIADYFSEIANQLFLNSNESVMNTLDAWIGAISYSIQIYFDFSGYTDMALGSALIFGIRLPLNFDSPYKQYNIIDFWNTWHMTLSKFLKDYLYIPLGGNRKGTVRKYLNLMTTMLLGGLWHGASFQFVIWGAGHGVLLVINHWFRKKIGGLKQSSDYFERLKPLYWFLTFSSVTILWVFFRADTFENAINILDAMFVFQHSEQSQMFDEIVTVIISLVCVLLALRFLPNSQQIVGYNGLSVSFSTAFLSKKGVFIVALLLCVTLLKLMTSGYEEFIYRFF